MFLGSPPRGSYFLTAKSNKNSRLLIFLSKKVVWLIVANRKIRDRKLAERIFERLSLATNLIFLSLTHVIYFIFSFKSVIIARYEAILIFNTNYTNSHKLINVRVRIWTMAKEKKPLFRFLFQF